MTLFCFVTVKLSIDFDHEKKIKFTEKLPKQQKETLIESVKESIENNGVDEILMGYPIFEELFNILKDNNCQ